MRKTLEKIVAYAVKIAEPDKIILFGSVSDGTNNVYSDLDLLIVVGSETDKKQVSSRVTEFTRELSLQADILVCLDAEISAALEKPSSFLASIQKTGKIIYQK